MVKGIKENRETVKKLFLNRTPVFIITYQDDWIGGYFNLEPSEFKCIILDWKTLEPFEVNYKDIKIISEFEGDYSKLPLPNYIKEEIHGEIK